MNFSEGGFILFSGTKKFDPVLAYSESGRFDINNPIPPVKFWMNDVIEQMEYQNSLPIDSVNQSLQKWQNLLFSSTLDKLSNFTPKSRGEGDISDEEYQRLIDEFERTDTETLNIVHNYINWGWGGAYDGYYRDDLLCEPISGSSIVERYDIINIKPIIK